MTHFMRLFRRYTAVLGLFVMLMALIPASAAAAPAEPMGEDEAVKLLQAYAIVRGDPSGALHLDRRLTRAEAATIYVRAIGAEAQAAKLAHLVPFSDAVGHWAAGEITLANTLGLMRGDGNGTFRPDSDITYAEVLTVMLRLVDREPSGAWDANRIMLAAAELGIAPAGAAAGVPAIRGKIFWSLAMTISRIQLASGQSALQKYLDATAPQLTVSRLPSPTADSEVTVSGQAPGAVKATVAGQPVLVDVRDGKFSGKVTLTYGKNRIEVEAFDMAGNRAAATVEIEREAQVARIEISGPSTLRAGTSTKITVQAFDRQNRAVPLGQLEAEMSGGVATFDKAQSAIVAGQTAGRGTLTLVSGSVRKSFSFTVTGPAPGADRLTIAPINGNIMPLPGKEVTVKVHVTDSNGKLMTNDYWRQVTLDDSGLAGVTVRPSSALTEAGVATFTISSSREGKVNLVAKSNGLTDDEAAVQFMSAPRVILTASPDSLKADGTSSLAIRATLQDEKGKAMSNTSGSDIRIALQASGTDADFTEPDLVIRSRASSSNASATLKAGVHSGTVEVTGDMISSHSYPVTSLSIPVTAGLPGARLQVTGPSGTVAPNHTATFTVKVLDASNRVVTTGAYAFQLQVSTSNGEKIVGGLPEGVTVSFPSSDLRPIDDGRRDSDPENDPEAVVGRTYRGTAEIRLSYAKSGTVTVTPKLLGPADEAYHPSIGFGPAAATTEMDGVAGQVLYAGTAAGLALTVDSDLGKNLPGGAVNAAKTMTVRVQVVDANGGDVPQFSKAITLTRTSAGGKVTRLAGSSADRASKSATQGQAVFEVQATNTEGFDVYTASAPGLPSHSVTLAVRKTKAETPEVVAVWGIKEDGQAPVTGYVAPDDDYLEILLAHQAPPNAAEPTYWATAKVYRQGESRPFFTGAPVDLNSAMPVIRVPKASLRAGTATYQVTLNNGAGDTAQRSPDNGQATAVNATYSTGYRLNSALFDAATGRLTLSTTALASNGTFDPTKLTVVKGSNRLALASHNVAVVSVAKGSAVLQSDELIDAMDPAVFYGDVTMEAEDGWFASADGGQVARGATGIAVRPMGNITHATLDLSGATKRLYLHGFGFDQGTLNLAAVKIGGVALRPGTNSSLDRVTSTTATQVSITLSQATLDAITALQGPSIAVTADTGWLRVASGGATYHAGAITGDDHRLYTRVVVSSAPYVPASNKLTLRGSGFAGATLDPAKLSFHVARSTAVRRLASGTTAVTVSDSVIEIQLTNADAGYFESSSGYAGKTVFLNTDEGWLESGQGLMAAPLPADTVRFAPTAR
ncbi:MAG TPA: S-layer homology domain-containing protein [Symbiobacteriaceae bacterium]|nr:S-layer homology domain-containing protein [Symbiobacteriaceae bacterium]